MTYDDDNRLATFNGQSVTHDADGNMTNGPLTNDTLVSYTYDARNRLTGVGGTGSTPSVSYAYDPAGLKHVASLPGSRHVSAACGVVRTATYIAARNFFDIQC